MKKKLTLYTDLAKIYDEIYQKIFNYKKIAHNLDRILKRYKIKSILEVASGTGHLTKYLYNLGYNIVGTDLFEEMLIIARKNVPEVKFLKMDMRKLRFKQKFDAVICLGRSFTYMTTNKDVDAALRSFNRVLKKGGILVFDNFDGEKTIRNFNKYKNLTQKIKLKDKEFIRKHKNFWDLSTGITWRWECEYIIKQKGRIVKRLKDISILRAFLKPELEYFLNINGFRLLEFYKKDFLIVVRKVREI